MQIKEQKNERCSDFLQENIDLVHASVVEEREISISRSTPQLGLSKLQHVVFCEIIYHYNRIRVK